MPHAEPSSHAGPTRHPSKVIAGVMHATAAWCGMHGLHLLTVGTLLMQALLFLNIMACWSLTRTQANPCTCPRIKSHSMPASPFMLKNSCPDLVTNLGRSESSARQSSRHCGLLTVVLPTEPPGQALGVGQLSGKFMGEVRVLGHE